MKLPNNQEAERALLGGLLRGFICEVNPEDFYRGAHRVIARAIQKITTEGESPDYVTVYETLKNNQALKEAGGASYLSTLGDEIVTQSSIENYARIVKECSTQREVMRIAGELYHQAKDGKSVEELLGLAHQKFSAISTDSSKTEFQTYKELCKLNINEIEIRYKSPGDVSGVPTPWTSINKLTNGLQRQDLITLAGRPSMGKSAAALMIAEHAAKTTGPVGIFSLEMSNKAMNLRGLSRKAKVKSQFLRTGYLKDTHWSRLVRAGGELSALPIYINDTPGLSIDQIRFATRKLRSKTGPLSLIISDYLGLIQPTVKGRTKDEEIGEISSTAKQLAREMDCPYLMVCQLNRRCETRTDKRPLLSDLRDSGNIEQDSDMVICIYRDEVYYPNTPEAGIAEFLVRKNRNGPVGTRKLVWLEDYTAFQELAI